MPRYDPLIAALRASLSVVLEQNAVAIALEKKRFNISVGIVNDKTLFETARIRAGRARRRACGRRCARVCRRR